MFSSKKKNEQKRIRRILSEAERCECLLADGYDDCLIGICYQDSSWPKAVYDSDKIIKKLSREMSKEDGEEYFAYNIIGAYVGKGTPIFVSTNFEWMDEDEER